MAEGSRNSRISGRSKELTKSLGMILDGHKRTREMSETTSWMQKLGFLTPDLLIIRYSLVLHYLINLWDSWD